MNRLSFIAVLAMLEADQPTQEQWEALLSMYRNVGPNGDTATIPVQASTTTSQEMERRGSGGELLTRAEAAEYLGTTAGTLASWACTGAVEVPFVRLGRSVRYRRGDLDEWLDSQTVGKVIL